MSTFLPTNIWTLVSDVLLYDEWKIVMDRMGFEPMASCLQSRRSSADLPAHYQDRLLLYPILYSFWLTCVFSVLIHPHFYRRRWSIRRFPYGYLVHVYPHVAMKRGLYLHPQENISLLGARRVVSEGSITTSLLIDRTLKLSLLVEVFKDTTVFPAYSQVFPKVFLLKGRNFLTT